jgi:hypothetical protein
LLAVAIAVAAGPGPAGAGTPLKTGKYSGTTSQDAVAKAYRKVEFTLKKGKVTLTTEPTVAFGYCLSTPVFTLDGATASKKIGHHRAFTFTHTFLGNKVDKIHGSWTSSNEVEGYAIYHFSAQDLCGQGKAKVNFTASK